MAKEKNSSLCYHTALGTVFEIKKKEREKWIVDVIIHEKIEKAILYTCFTGECELGDQVLLNTTAVDLSLGSGGYHFIMYNISKILTNKHANKKGHIMKLRYTPYQFRVNSLEESFPEIFNDFKSLAGFPVIIGELHSMLIPAVAGIKKIMPQAKISYIMTDGGALPAFYSNTIKSLKETKLIDTVLTAGHSFGGDGELINVYTALIAAKDLYETDIAIITMGPGVVGSGTTWGFTGIEMGENVNRVNILGGMPIVIPRVSLEEKRARHFGISHHTITALNKVALSKCKVIIPSLDDNRKLIDVETLRNNFGDRHEIIKTDSYDWLDIIKEYKLELKTMGRDYSVEPYFFKAAAAAGDYAAKQILIQGEMREMKMMEKTIASKKIFEGNILKVELLDVELPDGKKAKREIVRHPGAVAMVPINSKNEIYLVKQFRKPSEEELLEIPAGKLELDEDPLECARRELGEEIGFEANTITNLASYYTSPGFTDEIVHIYLTTDLVEVDVKKPEDEFLEVYKMSMEEAMDKIENKEIKDGKTILGILLAEKFLK